MTRSPLLRRPLLRRPRPEGDDGVALLMALGYIVVFTALMLSMLAVVVQQVKPTAQARKDVGSLNAASSGLQAGLAMLRSSTDVNGDGDRGKLCTGASPVLFRTGTAESTAPGTRIYGSASTLPGAFAYDVQIAYYLQDPTDRPASWLADPLNVLTCPLSQTPKYAFLQSYGTGANIANAGGTTTNRGNRAQTGVYRFSVPAENIAGGRLRSYGTTVCVDAGTTPQVGSALTMKTCAALGTAAQTWEYRRDLTLFYGGNPALNLCIEQTTPGTPVLARCTGTGDGSTYGYLPGQQVQEWSFNDNGHFAAAANGGNVDGTCLQPSSTGAPQPLVVVTCSGGTTQWQAFDPDPEVGAGKAGGNVDGIPGSPTRQYVNFAQFGRCLDVTGQSVAANDLIAYPCKQAPDSTKLTFNQVWDYSPATCTAGSTGCPAPNTFHTRTPINDGKGGIADRDYCLTAPASPGTLVVVRLCDSTRTDQRWSATGLIAGSPETSYHLKSLFRTGTCLSVGGVVTSYGSSQIIVETCADSTKQRWNAPPPLPPAGLNNINEGSTRR